MKRWDENENNDEENLFPDTGDEDESELSIEYIEVLKNRQLIEAAKLELSQKEINYATLSETITYLEKNWFWKFKSEKKKLSLIVDTYQTFKALVDIDLIETGEQGKEENNADV